MKPGIVLGPQQEGPRQRGLKGPEKMVGRKPLRFLGLQVRMLEDPASNTVVLQEEGEVSVKVIQGSSELSPPHRPRGCRCLLLASGRGAPPQGQGARMPAQR